MRPELSAMIKIINPDNGKIVYEVDATDSAVAFVDNTIQFLPPQNDLLKGTTKIEYKLLLEAGVCLPETGDCLSEPTSWLVGVIGNNDNY